MTREVEAVEVVGAMVVAVAAEVVVAVMAALVGREELEVVSMVKVVQRVEALARHMKGGRTRCSNLFAA